MHPLSLVRVEGNPLGSLGGTLGRAGSSRTCVCLCYRRAQAPTSLQYAKRQEWTASGEAESESAGQKQSKWCLQGLRGLQNH